MGFFTPILIQDGAIENENEIAAIGFGIQRSYISYEVVIEE